MGARGSGGQPPHHEAHDGDLAAPDQPPQPPRFGAAQPDQPKPLEDVVIRPAVALPRLGVTKPAFFAWPGGIPPWPGETEFWLPWAHHGCWAAAGCWAAGGGAEVTG